MPVPAARSDRPDRRPRAPAIWMLDDAGTGTARRPANRPGASRLGDHRPRLGEDRMRTATRLALSWGDLVEVLEPPELRDRVGQIPARAGSYYLTPEH